VGRRLRWLPGKETLVAVGWRMVQGRYLFRPSPELNDAVLGVLGRAQRLYPIRICGLAVLSNHLHLLLAADDAEQIAVFMQYAGSKLAREVNRLTAWSGPVFQGRYSMIVVTQEEAAQVERFEYLLAQGCKEGLVERLRDWPGVHCARALLDEEPLTGHWFDHTARHAARRRDESHDLSRFSEPETLTLSPLPCWQHLSPEAYRQRVAEVVDRIERHAAAERARTGAKIVGARAVLAQHPHHRPATIARTLAPLVHAASRAARQAFRDAYRQFVEAFREAAEMFRRRDFIAVFPAGSFPPAPPFVPS
jgi:REP element-mobilizing transposase RayT